MFVLIGRAIVSWVNADPRNPIVRFLVQATEPPLRVIRRMLPANLRYFPLDIAFLVLFGLVIFAQYAVVQPSSHRCGCAARERSSSRPPRILPLEPGPRSCDPHARVGDEDLPDGHPAADVRPRCAATTARRCAPT